MNARLLTLTLITLLGLEGTLGATPVQQEGQLLDQEQQAVSQNGLTLAQNYRALMNQRQALLEQLSQLNQKTKPKDWNKLAKSYHQVNVHNAAVQEDLAALSQHKPKHKSKKAEQAYKEDLNQLTSVQNDYQDLLNRFTPKQGDAEAFQHQVTRLLDTLEVVQKQLDANAQALTEYQQQVRQLKSDQRAHNVRMGRD
ncbi:MAG: hypothetical protein E6K68_09100 [Nitrospirae bacterium]|nr:MAG: hypothetical protein E6K68_09100 [Nitrospirota bacterium]